MGVGSCPRYSRDSSPAEVLVYRNYHRVAGSLNLANGFAGTLPDICLPWKRTHLHTSAPNRCLFESLVIHQNWARISHRFCTDASRCLIHMHRAIWSDRYPLFWASARPSSPAPRKALSHEIRLRKDTGQIGIYHSHWGQDRALSSFRMSFVPINSFHSLTLLQGTSRLDERYASRILS